jgi:hypothetical protein
VTPSPGQRREAEGGDCNTLAEREFWRALARNMPVATRIKESKRRMGFLIFGRESYHKADCFDESMQLG